MDDQRYLYAFAFVEHEVRRYINRDKNGIIVAGGNGQGNHLIELNCPTYLFVDEKQAVHLSDSNNHRVMKWNKGEKEDIALAGGQGQGNGLTQLYDPRGLFVDT